MTCVSWVRKALSAAPVSFDGSVLANGPRIRIEPTYGKIVVPRELNAWAKVSRLWAVAGGPSIEIRGFATTCTIVIPAASTKMAARKVTNSPEEDAGTNSRQPAVIVSSPIAAVLI